MCETYRLAYEKLLLALELDMVIRQARMSPYTPTYSIITHERKEWSLKFLHKIRSWLGGSEDESKLCWPWRGGEINIWNFLFQTSNYLNSKLHFFFFSHFEYQISNLVTTEITWVRLGVHIRRNDNRKKKQNAIEQTNLVLSIFILLLRNLKTMCKQMTFYTKTVPKEKLFKVIQ